MERVWITGEEKNQQEVKQTYISREYLINSPLKVCSGINNNSLVNPIWSRKQQGQYNEKNAYQCHAT